ncbi:hypothetical protein JTB14_021316 [Gonioctena quinquepunctata]|nr:hypothetical protein JTB14_021316 [Gonioctena quinquepunctata]
MRKTWETELYGHFELENLQILNVKIYSVSENKDLPRLCRGLGIPDMITTADRVTRPGNSQKGCPLLNYGICISFKGAYEGRRHDAGIFRDFGLYEELTQNVFFYNQHFLLYGDEAYGLRELLLRLYTVHEIAGHQERQNFNNIMSVLRVSVEWGFGH